MLIALHGIVYKNRKNQDLFLILQKLALDWKYIPIITGNFLLCQVLLNVEKEEE